jgi:ribosomal protein S18 acetylase RimI-like enzyme
VDDEDLKRIAWRGIAAFQRLIGEHAPGGALADTPHYVASAAPGASSSLMNAAVPLDGASVIPHLDDVARFYAEVPKWGVWIDPRAAEDADALQQRGLVLDSTPVLMAAELRAIAEPERPPRAERVEMAVAGAVNDAASGLTQEVLKEALGAIPADAVHAYGTRVDDDVACVLVIQDVEDDAFVTFVATRPEHRCRRLASNLLAHALQEARQRGRRTTSLQASKLGQGIYARLGYRPLGEVHLYEKRPK